MPRLTFSRSAASLVVVGGLLAACKTAPPTTAPAPRTANAAGAAGAAARPGVPGAVPAQGGDTSRAPLALPAAIPHRAPTPAS